MGVSALKVASLLVYGCFEDSLFLAVTPLSFGGVSAVFFLFGSKVLGISLGQYLDHHVAQCAWT